MREFFNETLKWPPLIDNRSSFDDSVLAEKLEGKSFYNKNKGLDTSKHYGKAYLSEYVIKPNKNKINFNEFQPILADIADIIKSYDNNNLD